MPYTLIQISDCHLGDNKGDELIGLNTDQSLAWVIELIKEKKPEYDAVICSGDLSNEGGAPALERFKHYLTTLALQKPIYWLPGNHDDSELLISLSSQVLNNHNEPLFVPAFELGNWCISLFDSTIPKKVPGLLAESEINRMHDTLQKQAEKYHLFCMHHPLLKVGSAWIDPQRIKNAQAVIDMAEQHTSLKMVVSGHVHQDCNQALSSNTLARMISTPSTSVQFKPHCDDFTLDSQMPGFRWFTLHDDGSFDTGVERISERDLNINHRAGGY
ncbi:MAG: metallophosphoesterase [Sinobacterium sp.]|nr:metallophosphoesterase [Sinobacterium sp.]